MTILKLLLSISFIIIALIALYISIISSQKDLGMQSFIAYTKIYLDVLKVSKMR